MQQTAKSSLKRELHMPSFRLLEEYDAPPKVIWLTCGNTSNARLKEILSETLEKALELLQSGERLVEVSAA